MSHLVSPLRDLTLLDGLAALKQAHAFITEQAAEELRHQMASAVQATLTWGCDFKRIEIEFPQDHSRRVFTDSTDRRHTLIGESVRPQKLIEIVNQAATMERLMDAIGWALSGDSGLREYKIKLCHPTTSSEANEEDHSDHDLVLTGPEGQRAVFEVCDVASFKDGNDKEEKDLRSLGLLMEGKKEEKFRVQEWPPGRLFLVVSSEWKERLQGKTRRWVQTRTAGKQKIPPHLDLKLVPWNSSTGIFEVGRGQGFGKSPLCTPPPEHRQPEASVT